MRKAFKILYILLAALLFFSCYESGTDIDRVNAPGSLFIKNIPDAVTVTSGTGSAYMLFDGDTETSGPVYTDLAVKVKYNISQQIKRIKIFDSGMGSVAVFDSSGMEIKGFSFNLEKRGKWLSRDLAESVAADSLTFKITNTDNENAVHEIEIWTYDEQTADDPSFVLKSAANYYGASAQQIQDNSGSRVKSYTCTRGANNDGVQEFTFNMGIPASSFKRAIVKFDAPGLFRGVSASRSVNGHTYRTGFVIDHNSSASVSGSSFTDEINPLWLSAGSNTLSFMVPEGVTVSNVQVLLFTDNGWNNVSVGDETTLFDGIESTAIKYFTGDSVDFSFEREVEPHELVLNVTGSSGGTVTLKYLRDGEWREFNGSAAKLKEGHNLVRFPEQVKTAAVRLTVKETGGAACLTLSEVKISSSPVGSFIIPRIVLNYPQDGEYSGNMAYIDGYVYPDGENISIEGFRDTRNAGDGSFSVVVNRDSTRFSTTTADLPWYPVIKAVYNGTHLNREVALYSNLNSEISSTGDTGDTAAGTDGLQADGSYAVTVSPHSEKIISFEGVTIKLPAGSVRKETRITIQPLGHNDLALLDPGMVNVTWPAAGYRFLPHGKFEKDIEVVFRYARESLKSGMKDEDVFMYYYDEVEKRWKRLERIGVEPAIVTVRSKTNHFTDIINATLTVPEHPDALSFNPNSIKDIKAGDPSARLNLISPPEVNNRGDATVSYPIELPAGRLGLAPQLSLSYSSEGGNSWTGIGWSLSVQSVTVDTKFGVPRYEGDDRYILNGQALVEVPGTTGSAKRYRERVEGSFARIERFGDTPATYYWVVTDKKGTKSYYGQHKTGGNISVLQRYEGSGPVYQWCLERVVDTHGNCINYYYDVAYLDAAHHEYGKQIDLREIRYTGKNGTPGQYSVKFGTSNDRRDITTSGRPGFMTSTFKRLDTIDVSYGGTLIRRYVLGYNENAVFGKTRLESVSQYGSGGQLFNTHTFAYYEDASESTLFGEQQNDSIAERISGNAGISLLVAVFNFFRDTLAAIISHEWGHPINRSKTNSSSAFVSAWIAPMSLLKSDSFGINAGVGKTEGDVTDTLIDIDGDGLPDIVYITSAGVSYKRNLGNGEFDNSVVHISVLDSLGKNSSDNYFGGPELPQRIQANLSVSFSKSSGKGYFTDVNGDGLVDYVDAASSPKRILYNLTKASGIPKFGTEPPEYPGIIISGTPGEQVDLSGADIGSEPTWDYLHEKFYLDDPLRIWKAPFTGVVRITGNVKIAANSKPDGSTYETDGVKVYIQKNDRLLWSDTITDAAEHSPQGVSEIFVERGDEIIFRVNSIDDGAYDIVEWDPLIEYINEGADYENEVDENGKYIYKFKASEDFSVFGNAEPWVPSMDGDIHINVTLNKGVLSDDVKIRVIRYFKKSRRNDGKDTVETTGGEPVHEREYTASSEIENEESGINVNDVKKVYTDEDTGETFWQEFVVEVTSDTPVDLSKINLKTSVYYTSTDEGLELTREELKSGTAAFINVKYQNYRPLIESQPGAPWIAKKSGTVHITYGVESIYNTPYADGKVPAISVTIAVKRNGRLEQEDHKVQGEISAAEKSLVLSVDITVSEGDKLYFVLVSDYPAYREHLQIGLPTIEYTDGSPAENHYACEYGIRDFDTRLGGGWRNWYYARWCGNDNDIVDRSKMVEINESTLEKEGYKTDETGLNQQEIDAQNENNAAACARMQKRFSRMGQAVQLVKTGAPLLKESPLKERFYTQDSHGGWFGSDSDCWISGGMMSSTRQVQKRIEGSRAEDPKVKFIATTARAEDTHQFNCGVVINRVSDSWDVSAGAGFAGVTIGKNKTSKDYFDLNGDRYPDIVTGNRVQYTRPDGSLGRAYGYNGSGVSVSRTVSANSSWSLKSKDTQYLVSFETPGRATVEKMGMKSVSYSVSVVYSKIVSAVEFIDMNGDGLADYLRMDGESGDIFTPFNPVDCDEGSNINIAYNTGYGFTDGGRVHHDDYIRKSYLYGGSPAKFGVNWDNSRTSGGMSVDATNNRLVQCYTDMNGDGLPDKVKIDGNNVIVRYNRGRYFSDVEYILEINARSISSSINNSAGVSGSTSISGSFWVPFTSFFFTVGGTGGVSGSVSDNLSISDFRDVNGDGLTDIVYCDGGGKIKTVLNRTGRTNLLKTITNPLGGKIEIDYKRTSNDETKTGNTYDNPGTKYVMSSVTVYDNNDHSYEYKYDYANGRYDRGEREFLGFEKVTTTMPDGSTVEKEYRTDSYYHKGIETKTTVRDTRGAIYTVTEKYYTDRETDASNSYFVQLDAVRTEYYEGSSSPQIISSQNYTYDSYGNVSRFNDYGDLSTSADDVTADILYEYREDTYLVALPVRITVTSNGTLLRQRTGTYDARGNLRSVSQVSGNDASTTTMDYDSYGNMILLTYPPNERSQRYSIRYTYDQAVQTYPATVTDSFGLSSSTKYDVKYGAPTVTTDTNGNTMYYYYDSNGRMSRVVGPYDAGSYTISFSYDLSGKHAKCITRNKGYCMDSDSVDTIVTIDAMKRVISTAVTSEVNGKAGYTVSGAVEYDSMGRVTHQGQPRYNTTEDPVGMEYPTITRYDSIGRKIRVEMPDGTDINMDYSVGSHSGRRTLVTRITDQMGRKRTTHKDIRDNILAVTDPNGATTTYSYSVLGEIESVRDSAGNITSIKYDGFGRRTEINNPDTGRTLFAYDSAGNLTRKITAELGAKGKVIRYHYDHNRLVQVDYPFMDDVYYTYGSSGSGYNRAGRVYRVDNGTVSEELYFGKLGETIKSIKTIKDGKSSTSYTTKYTFDNLGRMRTLTYPDGEILTYNYGRGGLLKSAIGETSTGRTVYLEDMQYDAFGQRTYMKYGNGTESRYTYEPIMRRLQNLKTTSSDGKTLQNITYKYDNVGNITNRKNNGFNTNDDVVRNSEQSYEYDNMDRLTESSGRFNYETWNPFWDKRVNTYTSEYTYSKTGKILQKAQENKGLLQETNETVTIAETTYNWNYEYTGAHPNAVTKAGPRTYSYDLNGNMTEMKDSPLTPGGGTTTMTRTLTWDDENRLLKTTDSPRTPGGGKDVNVVTTYSYDAAGMRALKKGKYGTVQYVSDNYTVRNKDLISKHVFAGNTRLVSKTVMREEKSGKMTATEQGSYYYHPDHLGSSNVVTDKDGRFYEQIEFFPYGETWINNKAAAEQTSSPYKFTAKEYDPETGWYYYGHRYLDPRLSRWITADPAMIKGEYFPKPKDFDTDHDYYWHFTHDETDKLPGMGGVFNTINLDAYQYAGQNPVKLLDPDGNRIASNNRQLGGSKDKSEYNLFSHTYLFTFKLDNIILSLHTFSWGNSYRMENGKKLGNWHIDHPNDVRAAFEALYNNSYVLLTNDDLLDPYLEKAIVEFEKNSSDKTDHEWKFNNNCKNDAKRIFKKALDLYKQENGKDYEGLTEYGKNYKEDY